MTRSVWVRIKALVLLGTLATTGMAIAATGPTTTYPYTNFTTGCVAYSGTKCSLISPNNGINLVSAWTCTYNNATHQLTSGPNVGYSCITTFNNGCCNNLDAGTCPNIGCNGSH